MSSLYEESENFNNRIIILGQDGMDMMPSGTPIEDVTVEFSDISNPTILMKDGKIVKEPETYNSRRIIQLSRAVIRDANGGRELQRDGTIFFNTKDVKIKSFECSLKSI